MIYIKYIILIYNYMDSNIYNEKFIKKRITVNFDELNKYIDNLLLNKIKQLFENTCNETGFIKKDSVELIRRTNGYVSQYVDLSTVQFTVIFKCMICNPSPGLIIKCNVIETIKPGLIAELFPLSIIIPLQLHTDKKSFNSINIGDTVSVKIMDSKFKKNEKEIQAVGILADDKK